MRTVCAFLVFCTIGWAAGDPQSIEQLEQQLLEAEKVYDQRNFREAVEKFQPLIPQLEETKDNKALADIYFKFGRSNRRIGNFSEAHEFLNRALQLHKQVGDKTGLSFDITEIAIAHQRQGNYEESLKRANEALAMHKEIENHLGLARTYDTIGNIYYRTGNYPQALQAFEEALLAAQKSGDKEMIAVVFGNMGTLYFGKGDFEAAIDAQEKSHQMGEELGDLNIKATSLGNLANIHKQQGDTERALKETLQIISLYQQAGNRPLEAVAYHNLANFHRDLGNYPKALETLQTAFKMAQEIGDRALEAALLSNMGTIEQEIGNYESAIRHANSSLQLSKEVGETELVSLSLLLLGRISSSKGDYHAALRYHREAIELDRQRGGKVILHDLLRELGDLYTRLNDYENALKAYRDALSIGEELKQKADTGFTLTKLGNLLRLHRKYSESDSAMRRGIALLQETNWPNYEWQAMYYSAMLNKDVGKPADAIQQLKGAVEILERVRGRLLLPEHKTGYLEPRLDVFEELISQLVTAKNFAEAFEYVQKSKTRAFLDLLLESRIDPQASLQPGQHQTKRKLVAKLVRLNQKITEEQDREKPDPALIRELEKNRNETEEEYSRLATEIRKQNPRFSELQDPQLLTLHDAQTLLDDHTVLLDYFAGSRVSHLFAITKNRVHVFPLPSAQKLNTQIQELLQKVQKPEPAYQSTESAHTRYVVLARELYKQLLQPAEDLWKNRSSLLLATDGPLNHLPFELLLVSPVQTKNIHFETLPFLAMKMELQYVPSISALRAIAESAGGRDSEMDFLAVADPLEKKAADNTSILSELPHARVEVQRISGLYKKDKTRMLIGEEATETKLKTLPLHMFDTIHFASHGLIDEDRPQFSSIYLNAGSRQEDGYLTMREIFDLKLDSDLVVLSACKSGGGRNIRGEGIMGLARAFFCAGASSLVVSLWNVNDQSTADFMMQFYTARTTKGLSKAAALKHARIKMIQTKQYSHPYYWAPFVLIGTR